MKRKRQAKLYETVSRVTIHDFDGLPYVPVVSQSEKARLSRKRRFGTRRTFTRKTVSFSAAAWNAVVRKKREKEHNDPRGYLYNYEYFVEAALNEEV